MTDQSGAFPETLREAPWASLIDVVTAYVSDVAPPGGDSPRAIVLAAIDRLRAALERPRPAPPEPSEAAIEAALANEASRAQKFHYNEQDKALWRRCLQKWEIADMLKAAYAVDGGGSAGTGAAPPDTVESLATWLDANDWWDFSTVELATRILKRLRGGAAQPPPSAPDEEEAELYEKAMDALKPFTEVGWTNLGGSDHYGELIMVSVLIGDLARARTAYHALLNYEDRNVDLEEGNRG